VASDTRVGTIAPPGAIARPRSSVDAAVVAYATAIVAAEGIIAAGQIFAGLILDAALVTLLTIQFAVAEPERRRSWWVLLALPPLSRIISLSMPDRGFGAILVYAPAGTAMIVAALLSAWKLGLRRDDLGLGRADWNREWPAVVSGLVIGLVAFLLLKPAPLFARGNLILAGLTIAILVVFSVFAEELTYRGLALPVVEGRRPWPGRLLMSVVFGAMYLGSSTSLLLAPLMGLAGLTFAWTAGRSGSIWGAIVGHALLTGGLVVLWPILLR
jgi:membrane protease YdiL (CAAX protease family)